MYDLSTKATLHTRRVYYVTTSEALVQRSNSAQQTRHIYTIFDQSWPFLGYISCLRDGVSFKMCALKTTYPSSLRQVFLEGLADDKLHVAGK